MQTTKITHPNGSRLKIEGALRIAEAAELRLALRESIGDASLSGVDLSSIEECDTAALQLLYSASKTAVDAGMPLRFLEPSSALVDAATALGLHIGGINTVSGDPANAV
jgi:anti-anti-sigma regulatory factor